MNILESIEYLPETKDYKLVFRAQARKEKIILTMNMFKFALFKASVNAIHAPEINASKGTFICPHCKKQCTIPVPHWEGECFCPHCNKVIN